MRKRLALVLSAMALTVVMLPGAAVADDTFKSVCKKGGWEDLLRADRTPFANQGECVSYVAEGGIPAPLVPTYQSVCEASGGIFSADTGDYALLCEWYGISLSNWDTLGFTLIDFCATPPPEEPVSVGIYNGASDPDSHGCPFYP